jgi:hypothetical protein
MAKEYFGQTRKYIALFGALFNNIRITKENGKEIVVPVAFASKQKFIEHYLKRPDLQTTQLENVLPRMGFEITAVEYDSERATNPAFKLGPCSNANQFISNRVPFNLSFDLTILALYFEDALKIVEQFMPLFTPSYNILIKDNDVCDFKVDIPVKLESNSLMTEYEGAFNSRRSVNWQWSFILSGYYYNTISQQERITKSLVEMTTNTHTRPLSKTELTENGEEYSEQVYTYEEDWWKNQPDSDRIEIEDDGTKDHIATINVIPKYDEL